MLFAALHPSGRLPPSARHHPRYLVADDYPIGRSAKEVGAIVDLVAATWGTIDFARAVNPGATDAGYLAEGARWARFAAHAPCRPPVRLPAGRTRRPRGAPAAAGPDAGAARGRQPHRPARARPLPRRSHRRRQPHRAARRQPVDAPNLSSVLDELSEFLTGQRPEPEFDRVLTTVVFTDIVDSTAHAAALGDHRWRELLDAHDALIRDQLARFRGVEVKTTGDGFSPRSTGRHVPSAAARRSWTRSAPSASRCVPGCTPANASGAGTTSAGSPSTSPRARRSGRSLGDPHHQHRA